MSKSEMKLDASKPQLLDIPRDHTPDDYASISFAGTIGLRTRIRKASSDCGLSASNWMRKTLEAVMDGTAAPSASDDATINRLNREIEKQTLRAKTAEGNNVEHRRKIAELTKALEERTLKEKDVREVEAENSALKARLQEMTRNFEALTKEMELLKKMPKTVTAPAVQQSPMCVCSVDVPVNINLKLKINTDDLSVVTE